MLVHTLKTDERKEEKTTRWNGLKFMEGEKWRENVVDQPRKVQAYKYMIALEKQRLAKEKNVKECAIMFIDPTSMDDITSKYWEHTRGEILTRMA